MCIVYQSAKTDIYKTPSKCTYSPPQIIRQQLTPPTKSNPEISPKIQAFQSTQRVLRVFSYRGKGEEYTVNKRVFYRGFAAIRGGIAVVSPAQRFATEQYKRRHYDFTAVRLPAGQRQRLKEYAYSTGRSMSGLIMQAIRELLERENCTSVEI